MNYAVCNELFGDRPFAQSCELAAQSGFRGIEIAPFTLATEPMAIGTARVREVRRALADAGLDFVGLHWLLAAPQGLHLLSADAGIRARSWGVLESLIGLCGELGGGVMVLGSGKQRVRAGRSALEAVGLLREGLARLAALAWEAEAILLIEALPRRVTDVVNTLEEAAALVREIDHPGVGCMFDFHNCGDETAPWHRLIEKNFPLIRHVHLNDPRGNHPSLARLSDTEIAAFEDSFRVLKSKGYAGWVSLEVFSFDEPPERILTETRQAIDRIEELAGV